MRIFKLLFASAALFLACTLASAQNIQVSGTVRDAAGEPIPVAGVVISGTSRGVVADAAGQYSITAASDAVLVFQALGYVPKNIPVQGRASIDVVLEEDTELIDETIVVAYGTSTKSSFTGSAAMVKEEVIEKKIATNVTSALAGTAPGVQVISSSGDPTNNKSTLRIRGIGSMSASNDPLIVVDGVPYEGAISDINPQDVESLSVLKDASASAIYGHRGANGVILITTKKGKAGEAQVKFDARFGVNSRLIPQYDVITDPAQYYEVWYKKLYNKAFYANGGDSEAAYAAADANLLDQTNGGLGYMVFTVPEGELFIGRNFKVNPNAKLGYSNGEYYYTPDDWYKEAFHNGYRQEYNVSVSGSSNRFNYYASAGFLNDGGMVNNSNYKRYTARINAEYQAKDWLRFITNTTYSHSDSQSFDYNDYNWGSSGNIFAITNTIAPIYPLYVRKLDKDGNPYIVEENGRRKYDANSTANAEGIAVVRAGTAGNAVRENEYSIPQQYSDVLVGKWGVVATPIKGLTLSANIGVTADNTRSTELSSKFAGASGTDGQSYVSHSRLFTVNNQYLAEYKFSLGQNNFDVLAGYEKYSRTVQGLWGQNDHLYNPYNGELDNADGHKNENTGSSTDRYFTDGFLGRLQYDYAGKYFLSGSIRRDESSRFAKGHRWGTFGSVGGAWVISKESFMQNVDWVDLLKLKVSYGVQGNDNLGGYYPYANQYTHSYNEDTGEYSIALKRVGNENLTWESSNALNGGVDFELFGGYLNGSVEVFSRTTKDLLYNKDVPYSSGNPLSYVPTNIGSINNIGVEATLDGNIINTRNFQWGWNLNLSHYKNTITSLDESVEKDGIKGTGRIYEVGGSMFDGYMYKYAGVDKATGKALYYQKVYETDKEGNPYWTGEENIVDDFGLLKMSTDHDDRYNIGSFIPKVYGGFGTTLNAYGVDFSIQCSFQLGGRYYDGAYQSYMHTQDNAGQVIHKDILLAWTPDNTDTNVPRWDGDVLVAQTPVDRFVISSNYLSINNITLGYTLPKKWVQAVGVASLRVYVAGENLAVFSARQGLDPRFNMGIGSMTQNSGMANNAYGVMRNITGGVTLTF